MRKLILLLILFIPTLTFGQSYEGNYRAIFFNLFSEPKTIIAEFEVKPDNSINGKVKVGDEIKLFNGTVEKKGKFEAVSVVEGNTIYKLKGKFDKDNKISFIQRVQNGSGMNKSVSENGFEGTFAKVAKSVEVVDSPKVPQVELVDKGKTWLKIKEETPVLTNEWRDFTATIRGEVQKDGKVFMVVEGKEKNETQSQSVRITVYSLPDQKSWKAVDLNTASYRAENLKTGEYRSYLTASHIYKENPNLQTGMLEIVKETDTQMVFKLSNFRIKSLGNTPIVELNGFIYADKAK